ncbi:PLAC8-domain-containing protein [Mycena rebaudengoi]|nr:PLAC8-domain-containing protein [Mycena rebaudengoi]
MSYQNLQPLPTMGMQVGSGGNRNAANKPINSNGKRDWSNGLFDCFSSFGTCCFACWCPCVVYGQNKQRMNHLRDYGSPDPDAGSFGNGACMAHCCLTFCTGFGGAILQAIHRGEVRSRYSVDGSGIVDCLASFCCSACDLTQVSGEIELEEKSIGQQRF